MENKGITRVKDVAEAIEAFAPLRIQEGYDNAGLQVGDNLMEVTGIMLCLDVTEDILDEAERRGCNMIVSHHPLIFRGLKNLTGADPVQKIAIRALRERIAIYSAHTNLDAAPGGVSYEMGAMLGLTGMQPLEPGPEDGVGLGVTGIIDPTPKLEFLRRIKEKFEVRALRYSAQTPVLVIKRVAICGGSGASLIGKAIEDEADLMITGDVKYHDFTSYADRILIADIGHYEGERCAENILSRVIRSQFPDLVIYFPDSESNPIGIM